MAESQFPPLGRVPLANQAITASAAAPESSRTVVKLAGSIRRSPNARRQRSELAAKPISANVVKAVVRAGADIDRPATLARPPFDSAQGDRQGRRRRTSGFTSAEDGRSPGRWAIHRLIS